MEETGSPSLMREVLQSELAGRSDMKNMSVEAHPALS